MKILIWHIISLNSKKISILAIHALIVSREISFVFVRPLEEANGQHIKYIGVDFWILPRTHFRLDKIKVFSPNSIFFFRLFFAHSFCHQLKVYFFLCIFKNIV